MGTFPGLVDLDDPTAGWVAGTRRLVEINLLEKWFDAYEGVSEGLYRRVQTVTRLGTRVWVYRYDRPLDEGTRGPLTSWDGLRGMWPAE